MSAHSNTANYDDLCLATRAVSHILVNSVKTAPVPLGHEAESRDELFASTRWTMVLEAGDSATASAHALSALSELCQI